MNTTQQTVAIHEAMGWKPYYEKGNTPWEDNQEWYSPDGVFSLHCNLPPIDHNFLASAREKLLVKEELRSRYQLFLVAESNRKRPHVFTWELSPTQQLAALVKSLGLWKEE